MIELIIEDEAISANHKIYGINKQGGRFQYKAKRKEYYNRLLSVIGQGNHTGRRAFKFSRYWGKGKRQFDEANLIGGFKILVDVLTELGHLEDDNPNLFKGYYSQEKSETKEGYIEIRELTPKDELDTALGQLSKYMLVDEDTLIQSAMENNLIKGK